jgi:hypothetical protein
MIIEKYKLDVKGLTKDKVGRPREYFNDRPASDTERTRKRRKLLNQGTGHPGRK